MRNKLKAGVGSLQKSSLFTNSFWGILASALQNLFLSVFFVIIARIYATEDFAQYLIANALYQLLAVFSTFGLSKWFIREVVNNEDKEAIINRFFKIQLYFGLTFYLVNLVVAYVLYDDRLVHILALLFGFNIILDNLIYAIKSLNIAESQQVKTFRIQIIDSFLLFLSAAILLVFPFSIVWLAIIQVIVRAITINLFLKMGSSDLVSIKRVAQYKVLFKDIKELVYANWTFVIIGSISLIYWRSAHIIISKTLSLTDVAIYGIAYKIFQLALIIPYIVSTTVFPTLVRKYSAENPDELRKYYQEVFLLYFAYGLLAFTFIYSYADFLMPLIFGDAYAETAYYTKLMFLTLLVFPTAILQANLLVAIKLEKFDMIFNVVSLGLYLLFTFVGFYYSKSLKVINLSIFASFFIFHVLQDVLLLKRKIVTLKHALFFYGVSAGCVLAYFGLVQVVGFYTSFVLLWGMAGISFVLFTRKGKSLFKRMIPGKAT